MNCTGMSVSRKGVWDVCPQKYKYQYHLKMMTDVEEPIYFAYGSIVHLAAELYVQNKGKKLISEIAQDILTGKIPLEEGKFAPQLPVEYKKKLPIHLKNIQKLTDQIGFDGELEYNFKLDLDPPHGRFVTGFIDRLVKRGDKFFILDYKTTKAGWWRKTSKDIVNDLQLRVYSRVVQKLFNAKAENVKAALYYVEDGELVGARFSEESLKHAEEELLQTFMEIVSTDEKDVRGNVGKHCERCEFHKICPFYSLT